MSISLLSFKKKIPELVCIYEKMLLFISNCLFELRKAKLWQENELKEEF